MRTSGVATSVSCFLPKKPDRFDRRREDFLGQRAVLVSNLDRDAERNLGLLATIARIDVERGGDALTLKKSHDLATQNGLGQSRGSQRLRRQSLILANEAE